MWTTFLSDYTVAWYFLWMTASKTNIKDFPPLSCPPLSISSSFPFLPSLSTPFPSLSFPPLLFPHSPHLSSPTLFPHFLFPCPPLPYSLSIMWGGRCLRFVVTIAASPVLLISSHFSGAYIKMLQLPFCKSKQGRPLYCCPVVSSIFYLFPSPIVSHHRLDVFHISTHGVALLQI